MHGEHGLVLYFRHSFLGSSPYARGAPGCSTTLACSRGIIPVCTGSTWREPQLRPWVRDHPRMHGEHALTDEPQDPSDGSSPYARGAPGEQAEPRKRQGIIPVCTGSTILTAGSRQWLRDHPRMHGEHQSACAE